MAIRQRHPKQCWGHRVSISGAFYPNGVGAVDNTANHGKGFTVTRTAAGKFSIVLDAPIRRCISIVSFLDTAADADVKLVGGARTVSASGILTFELRTRKTSDGTTAVDLAANADNRINFIIEAVVLGSEG